MFGADRKDILRLDKRDFKRIENSFRCLKDHAEANGVAEPLGARVSKKLRVLFAVVDSGIACEHLKRHR